jgi:hypothetical protein
LPAEHSEAVQKGNMTPAVCAAAATLKTGGKKRAAVAGGSKF